MGNSEVELIAIAEARGFPAAVGQPGDVLPALRNPSRATRARKMMAPEYSLAVLGRPPA